MDSDINTEKSDSHDYNAACKFEAGESAESPGGTRPVTDSVGAGLTARPGAPSRLDSTAVAGIYEVTLSFRIEADNYDDALAMARQIGDRGLEHPNAVDVAVEEVACV